MTLSPHKMTYRARRQAQPYFPEGIVWRIVPSHSVPRLLTACSASFRNQSNDCLAAEEPMKRTWTIIGVADVPQSFSWYQSLLGLPETAPAHDYFGQIVDSDGTVLLCLHEWGAHEHPTLTSPH